MKILVTGADGQLGNELKVLSKNTEWDWEFTDYKELDITSEKEVQEYIQKYQPDFFINGAAYTAVDKAEEDQEKAYQINGEALNHITKYCNMNDCYLIHVSSDYVYHHNPERPLIESDQTNAQGIYAKSKLQGDQIVIEKSNAYSIIRTSWVYSSFGNNFVKTMMRLGKNRDALSIVSDQIGTPSYARDIAQCIIDVVKIKQEDGKLPNTNGVYNFSNSGVTNWAEFAAVIFEKNNLKVDITPITTEAFNAPAPRPKWSYMNKEKIQKVYNIKLIDWKTSLSNCLEEINANTDN